MIESILNGLLWYYAALSALATPILLSIIAGANYAVSLNHLFTHAKPPMADRNLNEWPLVAGQAFLAMIILTIVIIACAVLLPFIAVAYAMYFPFSLVFKKT
jgi:hypothetical protein